MKEKIKRHEAVPEEEPEEEAENLNPQFNKMSQAGFKKYNSCLDTLHHSRRAEHQGGDKNV